MPSPAEVARAEERDQLRRMRLVSLLEGTTLVTLVFVAAPLKHLAGYGGVTSVLGPIHGMAFLLYVWMLIRTAVGGDWSKSELVRMAVAALVPFGAFVTERALRRREAALAEPA